MLPGCTAAGLVMLFASMMAATGTPWRREMLSSVSPGATMIGVPPSQVPGGGGGGDADASDPVISAVARLVGAHAAAAAGGAIAVGAGKVRHRSALDAGCRAAGPSR